jgi:hypothetical protein
VEAPLLLWGPYLWANGTTPRPGDGLVWNVADLESDHVHPSPSGEAKVAGLLGAFLAAEPTAAPWRDAATGESGLALAAAADAGWMMPTRRRTMTRSAAQLGEPGATHLPGATSAPSPARFFTPVELKTPPDVAINRVDVTSSRHDMGRNPVTSATARRSGWRLVNLIPGACRRPSPT